MTNEIGAGPASLARWPVWLAMGAGVWLTLAGLMQQQWFAVLPWESGDDLLAFGYLLAAILFALGMLRFWTRFSPTLTVGLLLLLVAVVTGVLWSLLVVLGFTLAAWCTGRYILQFLRAGACAEDAPEVPLLIGAGTYGVLTGLLAHFQINYPGLYLLLLLLPPWLARKHFTRQWLQQFAGNVYGRVSGSLSEQTLLLLVGGVALIHFIVALLPEVSFDALALHLLVPSHMLLRQQWGFDASLYSMAMVPMLADWLFSIGYMLGGETAARLLNLGFTYLLAWQVSCAARWLGGSRNSASFAALLFLATPLTFTETSSLHVEAVWAAYVVAGSLSILRFCLNASSSQSGTLICGALMLGMAATAKAITLPVLPVLSLCMLLFVKRWWQRDLLPAFAVALLLFLVIGSIPYLTAWLLSGNPVLPFYNAVFQSSYFPLSNFINDNYTTGMTWDVLYRMVFSSAEYLEASNGAPGFQWLLLFPATAVLLCLRPDNRALLLTGFCILSALLIFQSQAYLRYVFPLFALFAALVSATLFPHERLAPGLERPLLLLAAVTIGLNLVFLPAANWAYRSLPIAVLASEQSKVAYLERRQPVRLAVELLNRINLSRSPVAFLTDDTFAAGLNADALYPHWYNHVFETAVFGAFTAEALAAVLLGYNAQYVLLDDRWGETWMRSVAAEATEEITRIGTVSVRRLAADYQFATELLRNADLQEQAGWDMGVGVVFAEGQVRVNAFAPITQRVPVVPGRRYRNSVTARCDETETQGRVQINWLDEDGDFLNVSATLFTCTTDWSTHVQLADAPENARFAEVYGTSHGDQNILLAEVSLR